MIAQNSDTFCIDIIQRLNTGEPTDLEISKEGLLKIAAESGPKIIVLHALTERVLYIHQNAKLAAHPEGGRK